MAFKERVNGVLERTTGYQLQRAGTKPAAKKRPARAARGGDRLLDQPAFVLSTVRSGSTLVRVLLNSHSQLHSPHELHLRHIQAKITAPFATKALGAVGLDERKLEYLLWDRMLHRELTRSGKRWIVNKTPNDVFIVDRILECWPDARFIFLLRHPAAIARSRQKARQQDSEERNLEMVLRYANAVEEARRAHPGITIRYEELTANPETESRRLCEFLGVPFEPSMLEYGQFDHGRFRPGLGDWTDKIKSGEIQPAAPPPPLEEIPPALHDISAAWGYLPVDATAARTD